MAGCSIGFGQLSIWELSSGSLRRDCSIMCSSHSIRLFGSSIVAVVNTVQYAAAMPLSWPSSLSIRDHLLVPRIAALPHLDKGGIWHVANIWRRNRVANQRDVSNGVGGLFRHLQTHNTNAPLLRDGVLWYRCGVEWSGQT